MTSAWSGKACQGCGKKKGPRQANEKYCFTCKRLQKAARSKAAHGVRIEATYGITEEQYWQLYEFQGGRCYICRWGQGLRKRLAVDHDHSCRMGHPKNQGCPECVRGLLCSFCNNIVGRYRDSIEVFQRAIDYLKNPPWQQLRIQLQNGSKSD